MPEPPPFPLRFRVTNPDAADYGRVGVAIDMLDEADVWQRTLWVVLDFGIGEPVAFHRDELMRVHDV
jgi:hypothetical protein